MDKIFIEHLTVHTKIGIHPWERVMPQPLELHLEIGLPSKKPFLNDRIEDAVDYARVVERIQTLLAQNSFFLLERLAEVLADALLQDFALPWIQVRVKKIGALPQVRGLGVVIERSLHNTPETEETA